MVPPPHPHPHTWQLTPNPHHPHTFSDHTTDHIPGMVLPEAAHQAATAHTPPPPPQPTPPTPPPSTPPSTTTPNTTPPPTSPPTPPPTTTTKPPPPTSPHTKTTPPSSPHNSPPTTPPTPEKLLTRQKLSFGSGMVGVRCGSTGRTCCLYRCSRGADGLLRQCATSCVMPRPQAGRARDPAPGGHRTARRRPGPQVGDRSAHPGPGSTDAAALSPSFAWSQRSGLRRGR
ncbi:AfsA-related hotdog domain-containing protein [Streptomyces sp. RLB3-6]|uniref:AfsA-related hotdog domain-containing protein n=1 Tax=Streptomyces sp. RLB3-6 TaxID=2594457 RepID=UPI0023DDA1AA|nr:AfsA-related hotdog domain-containing protein [Streptomyces sp. RLB3-6]